MSRALLVIDVQVGIVEGPPAVYEPERLIEKIGALLERARAAGVPVVFVQHEGSPGHRVAVGSRGFPIHPRVAPREGEPVVRKRECDAFYETDLDDVLRARGVKELVIAGLMTQYCVDTTCRRAFSMGYDVTLASDAHSTGDTEALAAP